MDILVYMYWFLAVEGADITLYGLYDTLQECQTVNEEVLTEATVTDADAFYVAPCELREFRIPAPPNVAPV